MTPVHAVTLHISAKNMRSICTLNRKPYMYICIYIYMIERPLGIICRLYFLCPNIYNLNKLNNLNNVNNLNALDLNYLNYLNYLNGFDLNSLA